MTLATRAPRHARACNTDPSRRRLLGAATAAIVAPAGYAATALAAPTASSAGSARRFGFGLIGDIPYRWGEATVLANLVSAWPTDLDFAIHLGDLKAGVGPCSDGLLESRARILERSTIPLVYVPGDNEWTDCGRVLAGAFDPLDRLAWLRRRFFVPPFHRGRGALAVHSQHERDPVHGLPENLAWTRGNIAFVSINLPGSRDGEAAKLPAAQQQARRRANERWIRAAFARASAMGSPAIVVAIHADPSMQIGADGPLSGRPPVDAEQRRRDPYLEFRRLLFEMTIGFDGQVLLVHGDTHRFRDDHPWRKLAPWVERAGYPLSALARRRLETLRRVECFGSPLLGAWVRIDWIPGREAGFEVSAQPIEPAGANEPAARRPAGQSPTLPRGPRNATRAESRG